MLQEVEKEEALGILDERDVLGPLPVEQVLEIVAEGGVGEEALARQVAQIARIGQALDELELDEKATPLLQFSLALFALLLLREALAFTFALAFCLLLTDELGLARLLLLALLLGQEQLLLLMLEFEIVRDGLMLLMLLMLSLYVVSLLLLLLVCCCCC